jgi:hypothetical protein
MSSVSTEHEQTRKGALARAERALAEAAAKGRKARAPRRPAGPEESDDDVAADDLRQFCRRWRLSLSMFYKLKSQGLAPRTMNIGTKVLITRQAQAEWAAEREGAAETSRHRNGR